MTREALHKKDGRRPLPLRAGKARESVVEALRDLWNSDREVFLDEV